MSVKRKLEEGEDDETDTHIKNPKTLRMYKKDGVLGKSIVDAKQQNKEMGQLKEKLKETEFQLKKYKMEAKLEHKDKNEYMLRGAEIEQELMVFKRKLNGEELIDVNGEMCSIQVHGVTVGYKSFKK